jgi:hypothetical protein
MSRSSAVAARTRTPLVLAVVVLCLGFSLRAPLAVAAGTTATLNANESLHEGQALQSASGRFTARMQGDGNFVLYPAGQRASWASGTTGAGVGAVVTMQGDGNLVVYTAQGHPAWASGTAGRGPSMLVMQDDGNLVAYAASGATWSSKGGRAAPPSTLAAGHSLGTRQSLRSPDGRFAVVMQDDGNLVVYAPGGRPAWASGTSWVGSEAVVTMRQDGNLVIFRGAQAYWESGTAGPGSSTLVMQDDGNLVIYGPSFPLWSSRSGRTPRATPPPLPNPGGQSSLNAVTCLSALSCWAVGFFGKLGAESPEILHWDGRGWSQVSAPRPTPTGDAKLRAVHCTSTSDCWAVGSYAANALQVQGQAMHWDGNHWSQIPVPALGSPSNSRSADGLTGVSCQSPTSCWATGDYLNSTGAQVTEALRWDGAHWTQVATPTPGGQFALAALACPSSTDCWAGGPNGDNHLLHWDGITWTAVSIGPVNSPFVESITCSSPASCWAVGSYYGPQGGNIDEALHYDGSSWMLIDVPNPGGAGQVGQWIDVNSLFGVACPTTNSCWAVGFYRAGGSPPVGGDAMRWNGTTWSQALTPNPQLAPNALSVSCTATDNCWAVGGFYPPGANNSLNYAMHWNGKTWTGV